MTGKNNSGEIQRFCTGRKDDYQRFDHEFRITDRLENLGGRWKQNISMAAHPQDLQLRIWLEGYVKQCMPAIDSMIAEAELEFCHCGSVRLTEGNVALRRKKYRASRSEMKRLMEKLDAIGEFLLLQKVSLG